MNLDYYTRTKISYRKKNLLGSFAVPAEENFKAPVPISENEGKE